MYTSPFQKWAQTACNAARVSLCAASLCLIDGLSWYGAQMLKASGEDALRVFEAEGFYFMPWVLYF
jgi:hypothetical protein